MCTVVSAAALLFGLSDRASAQVTFDWATVGNPGNAADSLNAELIPCIGSVPNVFRIAKHEVTDSRYAEFLKKVDAAGTNPNAVYNTNMGSDARGGISFDAGATGAGVGSKLPEDGKSEDAVPKGLTHSDWKSIRQEYERHRHAAVAVDGDFRARNPGQQWLTRFDGRGFTVEPAIAGVEPEEARWRWGLELQSYGFPGHQRVISGQANVTAQDNRVTYDWDAGLREWFVNDRRGLEHGFTLVSRPPGAGDSQLGAGDPRPGAGVWLELRLAVRGDLRAQEHADGRGVSFVDEQGHAVVHYTGLKVWDADNRQLSARIEADAAGLRLAVDQRGARYPLTIDPIAQQAYLKASNTDSGDWFGWSVAVSGDTVVVGAYLEDSNATGVNGNQADNSAGNSGAAYVFVITPLSVCGDGMIEGGEECDDGDLDDGDGCSAACTVEAGFVCSGEPSVCLPDCNNNGIDDGDETFGLVLFVDADAAPGGDGTSWASAVNDLQAALCLAAAFPVVVDEIWVADGTYTPTSGADRSATFQLLSGVGVYGGFAGGETDLSQRDPQANETILSGDLLDDDTPVACTDDSPDCDSNGLLCADDGFCIISDNNGENSFHVVTGSGTDGTAVLDGFTISGGKADGSNPDFRGGGMYSLNGSYNLANCTFIGNTATSGGGLYNNNIGGGAPTLVSVVFAENSSGGGGGMVNIFSDAS